MATNKNITIKQFNGTDYDTLYPKTKIEQVEGAYTQQQILSDSTKTMYGLDETAVPDDAFRTIPGKIEPIGTVKTSLRTDLSDDWLLANGEMFDSNQYPGLLDLIPADITKKWPVIEIPQTPFPSPVDGHTTTETTYSGDKYAAKVYGEYLYILFKVPYDSGYGVYLARIKKDFSGDFEISKPISYYVESSTSGFYPEDFAIDETTGKIIVVGSKRYSASASGYGFAFAYADNFDGVWTEGYKSDSVDNYIFPQIEFVNGVAFCAIGVFFTTTASKAFRYAYSINYGHTWTYKEVSLPYNYFNGMVIKKVSDEKILLFYASASINSTSYKAGGSSSSNWGFVIAEFNASSKSLTTLETVKKTSVYGSSPNLGLIPFRGAIICSYSFGSYMYTPETGELSTVSNTAFKNLVGTTSWYDSRIDKYWVITAPLELCVLDNVDIESTVITNVRSIQNENNKTPSDTSLNNYPRMVFNDFHTFIFWPYTGIYTGTYLYGNYSPYWLPTITLDNAYCYIKGR